MAFVPTRAFRLDGLAEFGDLLAEPAADEFAELEDRGVGDGVVHRGALLVAAEDAGLVEHAEVLGDVLLGGTEVVGELADRGRAVAELFKQPDAHRFADDPEAVCHQFEEWLG